MHKGWQSSMVAVEGNHFVVQSLRSSMMTMMVPTVPPPPLVASNNKTPDSKAPLDVTIHKLRNLLYGIALPKTRTSKTVAINIETLCLAHGLVESACALSQEHHGNLQLDGISRQLENIKTQLDASNPARPPQKTSYAATLSTGIKSPALAADTSPPRPHTTRQYIIMLSQKSCDRPVLIDLSNEELIARILGALCAANVWFEDRPCMPDSEGNERIDQLTPHIRAAG